MLSYLLAFQVQANRITIQNVRRQDWATYQCIASNRVSPAVNRNIELRVECKPVIVITLFFEINYANLHCEIDIEANEMTARYGSLCSVHPVR